MKPREIKEQMAPLVFHQFLWGIQQQFFPDHDFPYCHSMGCKGK